MSETEEMRAAESRTSEETVGTGPAATGAMDKDRNRTRLSPLVVYRNLRARRSFSNLLHPDDMISTSTIPPADARSPSSTRQTILGFMGRRARSATTGTPPATNPSPPLSSPNLPAPATLGLSGVESHLHLHLPSLHRHSPADDQPTGGRLGGILRRRGGDTSPHDSPAATSPAAASPSVATPRAQAPSTTPGPTHRLRLVPHLDPSARTLHFEPIIRDVRSGGAVLRIGRFTDRLGTAARQSDSTKIAFKSKVVSRAHAEIWCAPSGKFMIRDTRSSSGTFLNHTRLSAPNIESRPTELHDGDIVQLGVDYQGGAEEIYRCVKIKVEIGREWQREANEFNTVALKQLQTLQAGDTTKGKEKSRPSTGSVIAGPSNSRKTSVADCCICLFPVAILQSLFIAPCSHCFHYKCIRPMLEKHHPGFSCPLCRTFADLEEDVEQEYAPSVYAPSVHAPSVHEAEGVVVEGATETKAVCVDVCVGTSPDHSPRGGSKALPPVPGPSGVERSMSTDTDVSTDTDGGLRPRPASTHSRPEGIHSDGGSTPRGSSEDLRAAQRGLFDATLVADPEERAVRVPGGILVPRTPDRRTPDRERDILNS